MKQTHNLELIYKNDEGKATKLTIKDPKTQLQSEAVLTAMNDISQADIFIKEGVRLYHEVQSARYVTRTVEEIFDLEA